MKWVPRVCPVRTLRWYSHLGRCEARSEIQIHPTPKCSKSHTNYFLLTRGRGFLLLFIAGSLNWVHHYLHSVTLPQILTSLSFDVSAPFVGGMRDSNSALNTWDFVCKHIRRHRSSSNQWEESDPSCQSVLSTSWHKRCRLNMKVKVPFPCQRPLSSALP